jgi:hypothetical protein
MLINGQWGTICDLKYDNWGWPEVICIELGFRKAKASDVIDHDELPPTDLDVVFESPYCNPNNAALMVDCKLDPALPCGHDNDVYVECFSKSLLIQLP